MKIELFRIGPEGVMESEIKEMDGPLDSDLNQHRLDVAQYGLVINPDRTGPGPCYNNEDPLLQCQEVGECGWVTYRTLPDES